MGLVNAEIELSNPRERTIRPLKVRALVDTGAVQRVFRKGPLRCLPLMESGEGKCQSQSSAGGLGVGANS